MNSSVCADSVAVVVAQFFGKPRIVNHLSVFLLGTLHLRICQPFFSVGFEPCL